MDILTPIDLELKQSLVEEDLNRLFPNRRVARVLLVTPPDADASMFNFATGKRGRYWNFPAYGTGVLASHLRKEEIEVELLNLNDQILKACRETEHEEDFNFDRVWQEQLARCIDQFKPDFIGISCMFSQTHKSTVSVVDQVRSLCPLLPIALGGVHITNCFINKDTSDLFLQDFGNADFLFTYESDLAFRKFVKVVARKDPVIGLSQVYINGRQVKGYCSQRLTPAAEDLNIIPAFDLMHVDEMAQNGKIGSFYCHTQPGTILATSLSNRGCRAACTFCSVRNFNGDGVRSRSVQSVIDELLMLRDKYGVGHVMWLDDDFLNGAPRAMSLFNEMVRQNVGMTWDCTNGVLAMSCTDEMMAAAAESGCIGLNIGMESGNPEILKQIKKPALPKTLLRAAEVLKKHEQIAARVFLIIGFPGETYRKILDTIELSTQMDLDWYNITTLQPLPNTPIYNSMVQQGLIKKTGFTEIRYNSGGYGKQRTKVEKKVDLRGSDFSHAFEKHDLDSIPEGEDLDEVWAYMNYHLNFRRLSFETRPVKLMQKLQYVQNITDLVAPESAFAMYYCGLLQQKVSGFIETHLIESLEHTLATSDYWRGRFEDYHLSIDHLKTGNFPEIERDRSPCKGTPPWELLPSDAPNLKYARS